MIVSGSFVVGISWDAPVIVKIKKYIYIVGKQAKCVRLYAIDLRRHVR